MAKVFLKDVVQRIKDNVDKDNTQLEYYIGGEHFDSGEIRITKKGVIKGSTIGPAFHMRFQPRDVLLMSRNPHLKKMSVMFVEPKMNKFSYKTFYHSYFKPIHFGILQKQIKKVLQIFS